jgi:Tol biopolymer transport system component
VGQIYAKLLPDGEPVQLTHDELDKMSPEFSPDGSRIAYTAIPPEWNTWVVPVLGGEPRLMLANAAAVTWIDATTLLFSEIGKGMHMSIVTASENRADSRTVYVPPRERGMAHRSAISPDHKWVLVAHMDNGGWLPCLVVPFGGGSAGRVVGPKGGGCTYAAWSPDGAWMYFSSDAGGRFHLWRQRFPDGVPQQVTSGATEEEGIAIAPDGRSLITSVGSVQSTVMLHDAKGERQISSENFAESPEFSADGKSVFYLVPARGVEGHKFTSGELFRVDLETGSSEHLLPGFLMTGYTLSPDGKRVVFSADAQGRSSLWIADLDLRTSPRQFASSVEEDQPSMDAAGNVYFRASEGGANFLYRMKEDGSDRQKVLPNAILEFDAVAPNGKWATVIQASSRSPDSPYETLAIPLGGGDPLHICPNYCTAGWRNQGRVFVIHLSEMGAGKTVLAPLGPGEPVPRMPAEGLEPNGGAEAIKGAKIVDNLIVPGPIAGQYVWLRESVHRNLYRIPLS